MPPEPRNPAKPARKPADAREERLARALRENLKKRKAQQRKREREGEGRGPGEEAEGRQDGGSNDA